jgi:ATP-dependent exoDNAse (exonuclease V) beta subunit
MQNIRFVASDHSYWIGDIRLDSVTTLVKSITPEFDREKILAHCAKKEGVSEEEIVSQWERKAEQGREKGTMVHSYIEDVLDGKHDILLSEMNVKIPEMRAFDSAWMAFTSRLKAKVRSKEAVVGDAGLRVAGRLDLLLDVIAEGIEETCLMDWKTGKFQRDNRFAKLLPPFDDLDDCEYEKYSLQLSTYRLLLDVGQPEIRCKNGYLVHLKSDGTFFIHRAKDYRERVHQWLKARSV